MRRLEGLATWYFLRLRSRSMNAWIRRKEQFARVLLSEGFSAHGSVGGQ